MKKKLAHLLSLIFALSFLFPFACPPANAFGDTFKTVTACYGVSMAIKEDGSLWTWGNQYLGLLGNGSDDYAPQPVPQKILDGVVMVSVSSTHALAVTFNGDLYGWGQGGWGQLGSEKDKYNMYYLSSDTPRKIMSGVKAASAGDRFSLVVKTDGSLWSMGENIMGELGIGRTDNDAHGTPIKIMENVASASASSVGFEYALAVKTDGTLWAWGNNMYGQLGDGTTTGRNSPVKVMDGVASVATGYQYFTMAVKTDATLWAWGANLYGVLSDAAGAEPHSPVKILSGVSSVALGESHAMIIKTDGSLWALGCELNGRLGNGVNKNDAPSAPVKIMDRAAAAACGHRHTLIVKKDGSLLTCGANEYGELGNANYNVDVATPTKIGAGYKIPAGVSVSAAPTQSTVLVNGAPTAFDAYNINGSNYFKLHDLAFIVNHTPKQFSVGWDAENQAISLVTGGEYAAVGGEMASSGNTQNKPAAPTTAKVYINGTQALFSAYNIGGNNYFKLRDVASAINFGVTWDAPTSTIGIDTSIGYSA